MTAENSLDIWLITAIAAAAGGFMGSFGFWLIGKVDEWWTKPDIVIQFGAEYPFKASARLEDGRDAEFIRVRVKNFGRSTARKCKCYVRHIALSSGGRSTRLPSDELMLTSWVPREAKTTIINIPRDLDFLADLAYATRVGTSFKVAPVFNVQNQNVPDMFEHVGDFELEVVVIGENFETAQRTVRFRFDGKSATLLPL